jgi:hypothetical protein
VKREEKNRRLFFSHARLLRSAPVAARVAELKQAISQAAVTVLSGYAVIQMG